MAIVPYQPTISSGCRLFIPQYYHRGEGFEPLFTEAGLAKYKKDAQVCAPSPLLTNLAGG